MTEPLTPPVAPAVSHEAVRLGVALRDEYAWLQQKDDPQVLAYLEAENAYAAAATAHTAELQQRIYQELRGRVKEEDDAPPERYGAYLYYTRVEQGRQYRLFCRRRAEEGAPEEVILDENALAEGLAYCRVFAAEPSPDGALLAYTVDTTGAWEFELSVKDMRSGQVLSGPIAKTAWSVAWASDSRTVLYTRFDAAHRPFQVLRHTVGSDPAGDALVLHEPDDGFNLEVQRSRSEQYLIITAASHTTSEVHVLPADRPADAPLLVEPRRPRIEYYLEHHGDRFLIRANDAGENFRLAEAPAATPGRQHWRELIPHRDDTLLESVAAFRSFLAVYERRGGLQQIRISAPDAVSDVRYVAFPEPVYTVGGEVWGGSGNPDFEASELRFRYSSLVTPPSVVAYEAASGAWRVLKRQEIPSGYDPAGYVSERLWATAPDGARVPISIVYRKGFTRDGSHPLLLYGYGSYGFSIDPSFDAKRLSLLDRGFAYAIAHIRGGSELGRSWYEQGRLLNKKNTFTDFIACAEHLVAEGYTAPERLGIAGASAGGLLVSAVVNMRPDLFRAAAALVPFTNVITAMVMPELPLTVSEWEQWGNPQNPDELAYMQSYSPYDNVRPVAYPEIYVEAGLNDLQVPYWDPAKWVARLRARAQGGRVVLFTNMAAGHSGASGRFSSMEEDARMYAFLVDTLGAYDEAG